MSINKEISRALGIDDIFRIAGKYCNVLPYSEIHNISNIDYLFDYNPFLTPQKSFIDSLDFHPKYEPNSCLILYLTKDNYGHWCVLNRLKGTYQFLDSYGEIFDDQLSHIDKKYRIASDQNERYLTKLLLKKSNQRRWATTHDIHYNDVLLQLPSDKISTCGRYAALFIKMSHIPVEEFVKIIQEAAEMANVTPDRLVTLISI